MSKKVKGKAALAAFAELFDPIVTVANDPELTKLWNDPSNTVAGWLGAAIKAYPDTFGQVLGLLTDRDPSEMSFLDVFDGIDILMGERRLMRLFIPHSLGTQESSGGAMENTGESET